MSTIRAGIIGCGVIGPTHAAALALDTRAELVWACDLDIDKAKDRIEAAKYTADYQEMLADPDLDLVAVCTPHPNHPQLAMDILSAGKHLVSEKPLGSHPDEVTKLVNAAQAARKQGQVTAGIFQHRYRPLVRRLHQLFRGGDFGALKNAIMNFTCLRKPSYYDADPWRGTWDDEGGGVVINQAIHTLDIMLGLAGPLATVAGTVERNWLDNIEVEDHAEAALTFTDGATGSFVCTNHDKGDWDAHISIEAEYGRIVLGPGYDLQEIEHVNPPLVAELKALAAMKMEHIELPGKACYGTQHTLQYQDVISAVVSGRQPYITIDDAAATTQAVLALYHSAAEGGRPVVPGEAGYRQPVLEKATA